MFKFDPTISVGVIVEAIVFVTTVVVAVYKVLHRLTAVEEAIHTKVDPLWDAFLRSGSRVALSPDEIGEQIMHAVRKLMADDVWRDAFTRRTGK